MFCVVLYRPGQSWPQRTLTLEGGTAISSLPAQLIYTVPFYHYQQSTSPPSFTRTVKGPGACNRVKEIQVMEL
jgi:hypothetical protein